MICLFLNDKIEYIVRYRGNLLEYCRKNEIGIEQYNSVYKILLRKLKLIVIGERAVVISSNLRSNLKTLLFYRWECKITYNV